MNGYQARNAKNRKAETLPLRADLADELRAWKPADAKLTDPVFHVPKNLVRMLKKDLDAAGIPYRDEAGRVVDVHALRHTFGTQLSKGGVWPRTAQGLMRHSDIDLTMKTYTDPRLLDRAAALNALPKMPRVIAVDDEREALRATGTDDMRASPACSRACVPDYPERHEVASDDLEGRSAERTRHDDETAVSNCGDTSKHRSTRRGIDQHPNTPKGTRTPVFRMRT